MWRGNGCLNNQKFKSVERLDKVEHTEQVLSEIVALRRSYFENGGTVESELFQAFKKANTSTSELYST